MPNIIFTTQPFPYTFPFTFDTVSAAIQVEDYDSVHFLQPALDAHASIANMPFFIFEPDPGTFFEVVWFPNIGQQMQEVLMPPYDLRYLFGDISNIPYLALQLFDNIHFGPDGVDTFQGPATFEILEGPADFELRTPE